MFWPKNSDLKDFYSSCLGQVTKILLKNSCNIQYNKNDIILGLGYCNPLLTSLLHQKNLKTYQAYPSEITATKWPRNENRNLSFATEEYQIPFAGESCDKIILLHCLEHTEHSKELFREIWQVLKPEGELILLIPNRNGLWAHIENNPFATGKPYTANQITLSLEHNLFEICEIKSSIFIPPYNSRILLKLTRVIEGIGSKILKRFGGVLVVKARKRIYANNIPKRKTKVKKKYATT